MADTTLPGVLLKGVAGSRPAANAVAKGTIYSATDTGAITQSDASSWSTFATISSGLSDPMTTRGDIIVRNSSNTTARLAIGSSGKVLSSDGTDISWQTPSSFSPSTVGTTSAGASFKTARGTYIKKVTVPTGKTLCIGVGAFVKGNGSAAAAPTPVVLSDNSGTPNLLIHADRPVITTQPQRVRPAIMSTTVRDFGMPVFARVTAGTDIWVGVWMAMGSDSDMSLAYNSGSGTDRFQSGTNEPDDQSVATYGSSIGDDCCIYAVFI